MIRRPYSTLYLDVLLNLVALLFLLINPVLKDANAKPRAEYTLTMVWSGAEARTDMDLYVLLPDGKVAWYRTKDQGAVFIDRDHLGRIEDGPIRREDVQWVKPVAPGNYYVSMNNYVGPPVDEVSLELRDSKGTLLWKYSQRGPATADEVPLAVFKFGAEGEWLGAEPSTTSVRQLRR